MSKHHWLPALLILAMIPSATIAQDYDPKILEAMERLHFLEGRWKGETWARTPDGERVEGRVVEIVESKLNGAILTLEGLGAEGDPEAPGAELKHHAFAVLRYDPANDSYRMHSYKNGRFMDAELKVTGKNKAEWGYRIPNRGDVRFQLALDESGRWTETGSFSPDGETWKPFFGMTLERVAE